MEILIFKIWTITKSGEKRILFREYSNETEEDIYKICPEDDKDCNFIEDINRFNYDPIAAIQSLSPDEITLYNNLTMDESYDALRALADINDTEDDSLRALADLADFDN